MKNKDFKIAVIGLASLIYGLFMSARAMPGFFRTLDSFPAVMNYAGPLKVVIYLLHTLVYICFIPAGAGFLMVRRWGVRFLGATLSAGLVLNLFSIVSYWYYAAFADSTSLAMGGKVVARSSIVPVYIIFIFQIAALYFINKPAVRGRFEEKRTG